MGATSITTTNFQLKDAGGNVVAAAVTYDAASATATLNPGAALANSTTYTATVRGGSSGVKDSAGNPLAADKTWSFTTAAPSSSGCPCTIWPSTATPEKAAETTDTAAIEVGVKFRADTDGRITGLRFYKGATNTGTHVGHLWTRTGTLLATATFSNETASGWQQVSFGQPVAITANTTYVASYSAPRGNYAVSEDFFGPRGVDTPPLHALRDGVDGGNAVYGYGPSGTFPTSTYRTENYWVDVVYDDSTGPDTTAPRIVGELPPSGSEGVPPATNVVVGFNEAMTASTITTSTVQLRDPAGNLVPAAVSYDSSSQSATLDPTGDLADSTTYTVKVQGGTGGVADRAGNTLAADRSWTFTTAAPPGPPPDEGAGGPILVIGKASNPFTRYYAEILRAEGLTQFTVKDISTVTATTLAGYDVAILGDMSLTSAQASMLSTWVTGGGDLVAMRPDKQLAGLLGLTDAGTTLVERLPQGRHIGRSGPRHRRPDHAVPRRRRPLRPQRGDERRRPLLDRDGRHHRARRDDAQRRQPGRPRRGVHVRPRQVDRLHAPGQPGVGGPGTRRYRPRSAPTTCSSGTRRSTRSPTGSTSARSRSRRRTSSSACW